VIYSGLWKRNSLDVLGSTASVLRVRRISVAFAVSNRQAQSADSEDAKIR
jgi:hypothetical protein